MKRIGIPLAMVIGYTAGWSLAPSAQETRSQENSIASTGGDAGVPVKGSTQQVITDPLLVPLQSVDACRALLDQLDAQAGVQHPLRLRAAQDRALRRWLEIDAESALAFAERDAGTSYAPGLAADLFRVWLDLDVESALSGFMQSNPSTVRACRGEFFANLAQIDPRRAVTELSKPRWKSSKAYHDDAALRAFAIWANDDPKQAAEASAEFFYKVDYRAGTSVAEVWGKTDPKAAWAFFREHHAANTEAHALLATYLLENDPMADIGDLAEKPRNGIAETWAKRDAESALDYARAMPEESALARELFTEVAQQIANAEPERVLALLKEGKLDTEVYTHAETLRLAFGTLTAKGVEESLSQWRLLEGEDRVHGLTGIMTHQFKAAPDEALAQWRNWLKDPEMRDTVFPAMDVALSWGHGAGNHDLGPVLKAIPEFGEHLKGYALDGWMRTKPEQAATFIANRVRANDGELVGDQKVVAELTISRPEFTADWLTTLPAGPFQNEAAMMLAVNWSQFNPEAAAAWIASLPEGGIRQAIADIETLERVQGMDMSVD